MSSDENGITRASLVARLRNPACALAHQNTVLLTGAVCADMREAADEIERLRAALGAIHKHAITGQDDAAAGFLEIGCIVRDALNPDLPPASRLYQQQGIAK